MEQSKTIEQRIQELEKIVTVGNLLITQEKFFDSADLKRKFNFSESKLYRLRKKDAIPHTKIGGTYYYPKSFFTKALEKKITANNRHFD